jgi:hypothetical protein
VDPVGLKALPSLAPAHTGRAVDGPAGVQGFGQIAFPLAPLFTAGRSLALSPDRGIAKDIGHSAFFVGKRGNPLRQMDRSAFAPTAEDERQPITSTVENSGNRT